ncbi:hypothetical protein [Xenorhabdus bovienii]|nr:hypothetical protein [Xenorhabdus bovienii]MDE9431766.1 hypothetical protein [Xenorhabdus bovienii]MDE9489492.1 hypothetical protein [Xenorhabdus bovienii]MDE9505817.1 hypothetical protein [Xenorhabdus bovienii]MDE9545946.1 hypothetical protein [Xenorhabdus bovienii]
MGQKINYGFEFPAMKIGGETSISYDQLWGIGGEQSETVTLVVTARI